MLRIALITDNKAGHESVSRGLIESLQDIQEVKITKIHCKIRAKFLKKLATILLNNIALNKINIPIFIKLFYKNLFIDFNKEYDLIISTGGNTSFLNILLSSYYNKANIYCSSLRGLKNKHFSRIVSIIDNHIPNEIVVDLPPLHVEINKKSLNGKYIAILIGGATKNYSFSNDDFIKLVRNSIKISKKLGYKILLSTSRRTPLDIEKRLKKLCEENQDIIQKSVFYNEKPEKIVGYFLSNADTIFCTEDSGSMITESILAKKRVYTIKPKKTNLNRIYDLFMKNITNKKYIRSIEIDDMCNISLNENFSHITKEPSTKIAEELQKIIGEAKR